MQASVTVFGHTFHLDVGVSCPADGDGGDRESTLDALVETVGPYPDERAELDARVRPDLFGFTPRERP